MERDIITKNLKFESADTTPLVVCFEPFCEIITVEPGHVLSVPIIGDINDRAITLREGEITIWEPGNVLSLSEAQMVNKQQWRDAVQKS